MLGKTPPKLPAKTSDRPRKPRERAVEFHVMFPHADDAVTRRLVRRIQKSIDRTLAAETALMRKADDIAAAAGVAGDDAAPARRCPPGCGAWWGF